MSCRGELTRQKKKQSWSVDQVDYSEEVLLGEMPWDRKESGKKETLVQHFYVMQGMQHNGSLQHLFVQWQ